MKRSTISLVFSLFITLFVSVAQPARTAETVDHQAMDILHDMAGTIAEAKQFRVTISSSFDAPQAELTLPFVRD